MGRSGHARALSRADGSALTGSALTAAVSAASGEPGGGLALLEAALEETGLPARGGIFVGALRGCAAQSGRWEEALLEILLEIHEMTRDDTRLGGGAARARRGWRVRDTSTTGPRHVHQALAVCGHLEKWIEQDRRRASLISAHLGSSGLISGALDCRTRDGRVSPSW